MGSLLDLLTGWALYAGLIALLGGCAARWILVPRASRQRPEAADVLKRTAAAVSFAGALLLLPALALFFLRQLLEFRDPFVPWTEDARLLVGRTEWGATWLRGVAAALAAALVFGLVARGARGAWWLGTVLALALGVFPALTGHASGSDGPPALMRVADTLHVWAAGGWAGGLAFVLLAEGRWRAGESREDPGRVGTLLPTLVPLFSPLAVACVTVLILSGAVGAWMHLGTPSALVTSRYGWTLVAKLTAAAGVFGLGFLNWRRLKPRLDTDAGPEALRRAATLELLVAQIVLLATALLVRTPPPMG